MDFNHNKNDILHTVLLSGLTTGFKASLNIIKIMIPISFLIQILKYFQLVKVLAEIMSPLFHFIGLGGEAFLVIVSGYFINCYSAIAVMLTLSLTLKEITILSVMVLLSHTLPIELAIQKKAGASFFLIMFIRISSSFLMGVVLNQIIPNSDYFMNIPLVSSMTDSNNSFKTFILDWLISNTIVLKIIAINIIIMIVYKILEKYRIIEKISHIFKYVMYLFGLPKETAFLWIIINVIGLMYGASILIEFSEKNRIDKTSLKKLNVSVSTCHSLVQETANFVTLGAPVLYLIVPRIIVSMLSTWAYNLYLYIKLNRLE